MEISVFGNPDYQPDSLPIRLIPALTKKFPEIEFSTEDPNELGIHKNRDWWIIDTVAGLKNVRLLKADDLKKIEKNRNSLHDFDLTMHLFWLLKIKKDVNIRIIGIPPRMPFKLALKGAVEAITTLLRENERHSSYKDRRPG